METPRGTGQGGWPKGLPVGLQGFWAGPPLTHTLQKCLRGQCEVTGAHAASVPRELQPSSGHGQVVRGRPGARDQLLSGLMGLGAWGTREATERAGGGSHMPG